mgnify:CR=1 FL=1
MLETLKSSGPFPSTFFINCTSASLLVFILITVVCSQLNSPDAKAKTVM